MQLREGSVSAVHNWRPGQNDQLVSGPHHPLLDQELLSGYDQFIHVSDTDSALASSLICSMIRW